MVFFTIDHGEVLMRKSAVATVFLLFLSANFAHAEFYRWVDKDGAEFFTNDRQNVPQEYRSSVSAINPDESRVSVGAKPVADGKPSALRIDQKDKDGKGEAYWRKRAEKLRKELAILQDKYDHFLKQEKNDENKPHKYSVSVVNKRKKSQTKREKQKTTLERDLARKKHELEVELPEEARKADAYPGWLRE
jgi:hypothetical protein